MGRALGPQVGLTVVQFTAVRQLRELLDSTLGPKTVNLSLAYGTASVPLIAAKYNQRRSNPRPWPAARA